MMDAQLDNAGAAFRYERHQHDQALQLASVMYKTGMDHVWKHGSLADHGLAAGSGGALLSKVTLICGRMADGGRYNRDDKATLVKTMTALAAWSQEHATDLYEVKAHLGNGNYLGPLTVRSSSGEAAIKHMRTRLDAEGVEFDSLHAERAGARP